MLTYIHILCGIAQDMYVAIFQNTHAIRRLSTLLSVIILQ